MLFQTPGFTTVEDIANRALQHCGANRISLITESSKNAREVSACYAKLRQAELRENAWKFAIKRCVLYPLDTSSMDWTPPAYAAGTTYLTGQVVSYDAGFGSRLWQSNSPGNIGNTPGSASTVWDDYFGPTVAEPYTTSTNYYAGDLVYEVQTDATFKVYLSLLNANSDDPSATDTYDSTIVYKKNAIVVYSAQNYISLVDDNVGKQPDTHATQWATTASTGSYQWVQVGTSLAAVNILFPIGAGPSSQSTTKNVYPLPYGFLRKINQNPKAGSVSYLGAPSNAFYTDWLIEGRYIVTTENTPIVFRFVADVTNVSRMDAMFCEGFAARIGLEVCEPITQSTDKLRTITGEYAKFMTNARNVNAIENDAEESPMDSYLAVRF